MSGKQYSLVIGRFQPLHLGHVKLIRFILAEGKNVCVAIRDTEIDESNPYGYYERVIMFQEAFKKEMLSEELQLIKIPDIIEVCYGRKVGWGVREIKLDAETEKISATKIRKKSGV